jgi:hypothetical protein
MNLLTSFFKIFYRVPEYSPVVSLSLRYIHDA